MRTAAAMLLAASLAMEAPAMAQEPTEPEPAQPARPAANFVVLMTDDQTVGDMAAMPRTRRLIGRAGVTFRRSFVSYPLCCPSRATYLTGQYVHNNGVRCLYPDCGGGYGRLKTRSYLPTWLQRAGYVTAHAGKFLNGYGLERPADVPRGWTEWYGLVDHFTYRMWGYRMHENGETRAYGKPFVQTPRYYQTDVLANKAVDFIRRRAGDEDEAPFFLSVAFLAPHHESLYVRRRTRRTVRPAPRHRAAFAGRRFRLPRSFNEPNVSDKPWFLARWNRPLTLARAAAITVRKRERWASLLAVDQAVERIVEELREAGELDRTYVLFTSDNGFMQGEHRVASGKMLPYDPSTRVPLLIRGPRIERGRVSTALVGNVDIAPTVMAATPATAGRPLDGRSILPFARDVDLRSLRPFLHSTGGNGAFGRRRYEGGRGQQPRVPAWRAVRTARWLFVDYRGGQRELYDLKRDPAQLHSHAGKRRYRKRIWRMRRVLGHLARCSGRECDRGR
jgi:N-acetylglucosamine-6-sulfatase